MVTYVTILIFLFLFVTYVTILYYLYFLDTKKPYKQNSMADLLARNEKKKELRKNEPSNVLFTEELHKIQGEMRQIRRRMVDLSTRSCINWKKSVLLGNVNPTLPIFNGGKCVCGRERSAPRIDCECGRLKCGNIVQEIVTCQKLN